MKTTIFCTIGWLFGVVMILLAFHNMREENRVLSNQVRELNTICQTNHVGYWSTNK